MFVMTIAVTDVLHGVSVVSTIIVSVTLGAVGHVNKRTVQSVLPHTLMVKPTALHVLKKY